jgi:hypothetical protein
MLKSNKLAQLNAGWNLTLVGAADPSVIKQGSAMKKVAKFKLVRVANSGEMKEGDAIEQGVTLKNGRCR